MYLCVGMKFVPTCMQIIKIEITKTNVLLRGKEHNFRAQ